MNPSLFSGSKLASWGISCDKTLGDERWVLPCGSQHHCLDNLHLKAFLWCCLPSAQELRECSELFTGLFTGRSVLWPITPVCYGRLGDDTTVSCEDKIQVGASILPLICWQGQGDGNKRSSCWDPKARSCHSKKSWLNHFGFINKFVLPSQSSPLSSMEQHPMTHLYWRSATEPWTMLDPWWWLFPSCFL